MKKVTTHSIHISPCFGVNFVLKMSHIGHMLSFSVRHIVKVMGLESEQNLNSLSGYL